MLLRDYVVESLNGDESRLLEYGSGAHYAELTRILNCVELYQVSEAADVRLRRRLPVELMSNWDIMYHHEFVEGLVTFMLENNFPNALTLGFSSGVWAPGGTVKSKFVAKGVNPSIQLLNTGVFEIVKVLVGVHRFVELVLFWNATLDNNLLWGVVKESAYKPPATPCGCVRMNKIMFQEDKDLHKCDPVGADVNQVMKCMFGPTATRRNIPRRFRRVRPLIEKMLMTHLAFTDKYSYVLESICQSQIRSHRNDNMALSTPTGRVVRFVLACMYRVIPVELFGSAHNRTVLAKQIPAYFTKNMHKLLKLDDIMKGVKTREVDWIHPRKGHKLTKHEHVNAREMYGMFVRWLFEEFVSRLVAAFFHVTEPAKGTRMLFYPNHVWNQITKRYKSKYYSERLVKTTSENTLRSFEANKDHVGKLAILPKATGFRLIVKPFKGSRDERMAYMIYRKKVIRPVNAILRALREGGEILCESVDAVVSELVQFRQRAPAKHYYAIKFDIKEAYDTLSHTEIERVLQRRLDKFTRGDTIYVQYKSVVEDGLRVGRQKLTVVDDPVKLRAFTPSKCPTVDKHETFKFTKKEILEIVRAQYARTSFFKFTRQAKFSYTRKVGVYQGFPMSGVLFNLIYDSVTEAIRSAVEEKMMQGIDVHPFAIVRLVDDFLVVSTSPRPCHIVRRLISREIEPFQVRVNRQKTQYSSTDIDFVGLRIHLQGLMCSKPTKQYNVDPLRCGSVRKLMRVLNNYMESRLVASRETLFSEQAVGATVARNNVEALVRAVIWKFVNSWRGPLDRRVFERWKSTIAKKVGWIVSRERLEKIINERCQTPVYN